MAETASIGRREFLVAGAGGGFALGFCLWSCSRVGRFLDGPREAVNPDSWLRIGPEGGITVSVARAEMGQGVWTSLPMIVSEELEAAWPAVRMEPVGVDSKRYGRQRTGGSMSVRTSWDRLRRVGATAREMLITAAARTWDVPREECRARESAVVHGPTGRRLDYGALAGTAAALPLPDRVPLKDPSNYHTIGRSWKRLDTPGKIDGSALFGLDTRRPGMRYAVLARCPVFGGGLKGYDDAAARAVPGVESVVRVGETVAVVAANTWAAMEGSKALRIEWDQGPHGSLSSESIRRRFAEFPARPAANLYSRGSTARALPVCPRVLEAVYEVPFLEHAPMEPMNCTADVRPDRCEFWVPSQDLDLAQEAAARITGLGPEQIIVHNTLIGGGFGRRLVVDYAAEAVRLSKLLQAPVQLVWSREDGMHHGFYHPASLHRLKGGLDRDGWPHVWEHHMIAPSILSQHDHSVAGNRDYEVRSEMACLYAFPHMAIGYSAANTPVPVVWMRSVYFMPKAFAEESFLDELAKAGGKDPLQVRRRLLDTVGRPRSVPAEWKPSRLRGVLELAADRARWGAPLRPGLFRGIASQGACFSYCAVVAEVSVAKGDLRVHRVVAAVDCGIVVNPDTIRAQVEGAVTFALSNALFGGIGILNGRIEQSNFHDYRVLRIHEAPEIEVHIVPSSERPSGIGEVPVPLVAPAVANAVFAATGKRVRRLPIIPALSAL